MQFKQAFYRFCCFCISLVCYSQTFSGSFKIKSSPHSAEVKDVSVLVVDYELVGHSKEKGFLPSVRSTLQIGEKYTKFIDANTLRRNSLAEAFSHHEFVDAKDMNAYLKLRSTFTKSILINTLSKQVWMQDRFRQVYEYQEVLPKISWQLTNETSTIAGYVCKTAVAEFRGRAYTAWYTTDIPISTGPYLFHGLPGLILKIEDSQKDYTVTAVQIRKEKMPIYWRNEKNIHSVDRTDFRKLQRNYFENPPIFITGKAYDANGNEIALPNVRKEYNPIELE